MSAVPEPFAEPPLYFVCYSRAQVDLVTKIEAKLAARRRRGELDLWRDKRNLDDGEEFTPAILQALQRAAGAIVVVSDEWNASDFIQDHEWPTITQRKEEKSWFKIFLLAFHALDDNSPLDKKNFVNDIKEQLLVDASDALRDTVLTRLSDRIGQHARALRPQAISSPQETAPPATAAVDLAPRWGLEDMGNAAVTNSLDGIPERPGRFVEPTEELAALMDQLAARSTTAVIGLQGEGGTGKSVLAAEVAHRTGGMFPDGVHWLTVGEPATSEDVRRLQARLLDRLDSEGTHAPDNITHGKETLAALVRKRAALIVVDDVWHPWQARAFDVGGEGQQTRVLITTRFTEALPTGSVTIELGRLRPAQATEFLESFAAGVPESTEDLAAVLEAAGGLRLALAVMASTAAVEGSWAPVLSRLEGLAERFGEGDDASSAQKALYVAMDTLDAEDRNMALSLGAFPADAAIPVNLLADLWDVSRSRTNQVVGRLAAKDLLARTEDALVLHDHVHDFLLLHAQTPASDVHLKLWELATDSRSGGWRALAEGTPYLWDRLVWHACRAGLNRATLCGLVSDVEWLTERIRRQGASASEQDIGRVCEVTDLDDTAPLSKLRRVLRHGGLFAAATVGASLEMSLVAWADAIGLRHRLRRRLRAGSLPVPSTGLLQTLRGHTSEAWGVAFSSDGKRLATCSEDGTARWWDIRTGQTLLTFAGHAGQVWGLALSRDDRRLATAGGDGNTRVWDTGTGREIRCLNTHKDAVRAVAFSPDGRRMATCGEDGCVRIWNTATDDSPISLEPDAGPVWNIDFSPDGSRLATADANGQGRVWESDTGEFLQAVDAHSRPMRAVVFSPDGTQLVTASDDGTAQIWDWSHGQRLHTLAGHTNPVWDVDVSPDGSRIATASEDGTARVWDARTGAALLTLTGHTNPVHGVAFGPDGRLLATAAGDGTARIWNTHMDGPPGDAVEIRGEVHDFAFSADNTRLLTAVGDHTARVWDTASGDCVATLVGADGPVWGVDWSPEERLIAAASEDRTVRIWDAGGGTEVRTIAGHGGQVWDVEFSHDSSRLATASEDTTARIWNAADGIELYCLDRHRGRVWEVAFSSEDRDLATGGDDGTACIWNMKNGKHIRSLGTHVGSVWDVEFSSDDRWLATACEDGKARIWDVRTGVLVHTLVGHAGQVWAIAFSTDDSHLATVGGDGTARIWKCDSGECMLTLALACSGPVAWRGDVLAIAAGSDWALIDVADLLN